MQGSGSLKRRIFISSVACGSFLFTVALVIYFVRVYKQKIILQGGFNGKGIKGHPMMKSEYSNLFTAHRFI